MREGQVRIAKVLMAQIVWHYGHYDLKAMRGVTVRRSSADRTQVLCAACLSARKKHNRGLLSAQATIVFIAISLAKPGKERCVAG